MNGNVPTLRLAPPPPPDATRADAVVSEPDGLALALLLVGLIPLIGFVLLGRWAAWELGAGAAMAAFALRQLVRSTRSTV
jgi:hypothetical protein